VICIPYVPAASEANKRPCIFFEHGPLKTSFSLVHMSDSNSCLAHPTYKKYHYFLTDCDQRLNNNQEYNSIDLLRLVTRTPPCAVLCLPHSTLIVCKHSNILPKKGCTVAVELSKDDAPNATVILRSNGVSEVTCARCNCDLQSCCGSYLFPWSDTT
jgi:hypothetical protein